ncbi:lipase 3 [Folsomia candida]|uniref:Lipase 3 n=1 Tax=Folsomia candida TaxID=158441 RepID=A0A226DJW4_FOLCA|nr:lipase 3 [Folsomia candida]OXA44476.1 Lipase 3 [Folsomia candida]
MLPMKSTLLPIQILLSIFSPTLRHRFEENAIWEKDYPEIKALMSSDDKRECHQQFKDIQDPQLHSDLIGLSIDQRLIRLGYPVQRINVTTEDGYILGIYRIPFSPKSPLVEGVVKKPVILQHGLGGNGLCFLIQDSSRNLAMMLADYGFDVYVSNFRGSSYSQGHIDPDMTPDNWRYWDFSFHEMGIFDVPAIIEAVTDITKQESVYYVGHSMGAAALTILLSERPEYNSRIATAFFLAPAVYLGHTGLYLHAFVRSVNYYQYTFNKFLGGKLEMERLVEILLGSSPNYRCSAEEYACEICANMFNLLAGYDGPQTNYTQVGQIFDAFPVTMSTKTLTHFFQMIKTNTFCQFNHGFKVINRLRYGRRTPTCYNMENISSPLLVFWGANDFVVKPQDIGKTVSHIPKAALKECIKVDSEYFTHLDFIFAKDANTLVYKKIVDVMLNATYG